MTTIVVSNSFTSWCQSNDVDTIPSTGGREQTDSLVLVPVSALKQANAKMVELKYEKEINSNLKEVIKNDSVIKLGLENNIVYYKSALKDKTKEAKKYKKQKTFLGILSIIVTGLAIGFAVK